MNTNFGSFPSPSRKLSSLYQHKINGCLCRWAICTISSIFRSIQKSLLAGHRSDPHLDTRKNKNKNKNKDFVVAYLGPNFGGRGSCSLAQQKESSYKWTKQFRLTNHLKTFLIVMRHKYKNNFKYFAF